MASAYRPVGSMRVVALSLIALRVRSTLMVSSCAESRKYGPSARASGC